MFDITFLRTGESSMATSISLHSPADVPELVRNSVMGCVDRTGEQSPSATRWMYGFRSSYDTTGTLARKVARPVSPASWPHLVRYSAPALRPRISERTRSCTASTSEVSSSMSRSFSTTHATTATVLSFTIPLHRRRRRLPSA
ncbi:Os07g0576550, partial [Oryza sativa Japonica Group]